MREAPAPATAFSAAARTEEIAARVFNVRGVRVMLSPDLAQLYGVETKVLMQAVRRNIDRFPPDFAFMLSAEEFAGLRSQFVTSNRGGARYAPMAFTEQGVAMLSGVLRSAEAIAVNIHIMRAFVALRGMLAEHAELKTKLAQLEAKYDGQFGVVFDALRQLMDPSAREAG